MKTALSIPDDIFTKAEHLRHKLGRSRSALYAEAMRQYLASHASHEANDITERLNRLAGELNEEYSAFEGMARRTLQRVEWE